MDFLRYLTICLIRAGFWASSTFYHHPKIRWQARRNRKMILQNVMECLKGSEPTVDLERSDQSTCEPQRLGHPKDEDVFIFAEIHISPDSEARISFRYGDTLPDANIPRALMYLMLLQAANIRANLTEEPTIVQDGYQAIMSDIVSHWPNGPTKKVGDFLTSLPFYQELIRDDTFIEHCWAANGGETILLKLAEAPNKSLVVYDHYPGMPGCGPPGLAINLSLHYLFLADFVLTLLDDPTCEHLSQALSELWLTRLRLPFDTEIPISRILLYQLIDAIMAE